MRTKDDVEDQTEKQNIKYIVSNMKSKQIPAFELNHQKYLDSNEVCTDAEVFQLC